MEKIEIVIPPAKKKQLNWQGLSEATSLENWAGRNLQSLERVYWSSWISGSTRYYLLSFNPVAGSCEHRQAFLVQLATVKVGNKELILQKLRPCVLSANCCFWSLRSQHRSQALFQPTWAEVAFHQGGDSKMGSIFHLMGTRHLRKSL